MIGLIVTLILLFAGLSVVGSFFAVYFLTNSAVIALLGSLAIAILITILLLKQSIVFTKENTRGGVIIFGELYDVLKPGLNWVPPFISKVKEVPLQERGIPLFTGEKKVDLPDGSVVPQKAEIVVQVFSPDLSYKPLHKTDEGVKEINEIPRSGVYRHLFAADDIDERIKNLAESKLYNFLTNFDSIHQLLHNTNEEEGFNILFTQNRDYEEKMRLKDLALELKRLGQRGIRITVSSFDLDEATIKARRSVLEADAQMRSAEHEQEAMRRNTTAIVQEALDSLGLSAANLDDHEFKKEVARKIIALVEQKRAIDGGSYFKFDGNKGGDVGAMIGSFLALQRGGLNSNKRKEPDPVDGLGSY